MGNDDNAREPRRRRWERAFLVALSSIPIVSAACKQAGISTKTAYLHRKHSPRFAAEWEAALEVSIDGIEVAAYKRALEEGDGAMIRYILSRRRPQKWGNRDDRLRWPR